MPDRRAKSSLSEKARIDLPVRVFCKNQNRAAMVNKAVTSVTAVVPLMAKPSAKPVQALKSPAEIKKRPPSAKFCSWVPMMIRTRPFMTNMTPAETITRMIGLAFCLR